MPDLPECQTCEFNRTICQSQRGMLLVYSSTLLFFMWTIQTYISAAYDIATDNTIPLIFGAAVAGGFAFYFYSKTQTDKANNEAKRRAP
jgi:hypothetical protein